MEGGQDVFLAFNIPVLAEVKTITMAASNCFGEVKNRVSVVWRWPLSKVAVGNS